jgi:hypothetical protein
MRGYCKITGLAILLGLGVSAAHADFFQINTLTNGPTGTFTGTLSGVSVTGSVSKSDNSTLRLNAPTDPTNSWELSVINGTSPQFSYNSVYAYTTPLTDTVGYTKFQSTVNKGQITISFGHAFTNLVFEIANLDGSVWDFSNTSGLSGLNLLSGNGGADGDGLGVSGMTMLDLNPSTAIGQGQSTTPLTSGPRSAYGSVELLGTYSSLTIDISTAATGGGDGGNFTLVDPVPEPASIALLGDVLVCLAGSKRLLTKLSGKTV